MEDFNEYFEYDETSPTCLRWKVERRTGSRGQIVKRKVGDVAGCRSGKNGKYAEVTLNNKAYWVHRVIWQMFNGPIEKGLCIDHCDRDGLNNVRDNLRLVSHAENMRNRSKGSNNVSGITGVSYRTMVSKSGVKYGRWTAKWYDLNGNPGSKTFSTLKYGFQDAKMKAIAYRMKKLDELNAQGAGYTHNHGEVY